MKIISDVNLFYHRFFSGDPKTSTTRKNSSAKKVIQMKNYEIIKGNNRKTKPVHVIKKLSSLEANIISFLSLSKEVSF